MKIVIQPIWQYQTRYQMGVGLSIMLTKFGYMANENIWHLQIELVVCRFIIHLRTKK